MKHSVKVLETGKGHYIVSSKGRIRKNKRQKGADSVALPLGLWCCWWWLDGFVCLFVFCWWWWVLSLFFGMVLLGIQPMFSWISDKLSTAKLYAQPAELTFITVCFQECWSTHGERPSWSRTRLNAPSVDTITVTLGVVFLIHEFWALRQHLSFLPWPSQ